MPVDTDAQYFSSFRTISCQLAYDNYSKHHSGSLAKVAYQQRLSYAWRNYNEVLALLYLIYLLDNYA